MLGSLAAVRVTSGGLDSGVVLIGASECASYMCAVSATPLLFLFVFTGVAS